MTKSNKANSIVRTVSSGSPSAPVGAGNALSALRSRLDLFARGAVRLISAERVRSLPPETQSNDGAVQD